MVEDCQRSEPVGAEDWPAQLCGLLTEQIAFARQGNMGQVERLGTQVDGIIAAMGPAPANAPLMAGSQRSRLEELYDELVLVLQAEQADVQTKLTQLQQVKRAVGVYNRKRQRR
jgi:hypothetical protein